LALPAAAGCDLDDLRAARFFVAAEAAARLLVLATFAASSLPRAWAGRLLGIVGGHRRRGGRRLLLRSSERDVCDPGRSVGLSRRLAKIGERAATGNGHPHIGDPRSDYADAGGGGLRQVDDPAADEGAAVVDADHNRPPIREVLDQDPRAERQRPVRRRELLWVHPLAIGGLVGWQGIPGSVAALVGLGNVDMYYRSGAEKSHRNHLGSHSEHALTSPYSVVWEVLKTGEESSRPHFFVQSGKLRIKKAENRLSRGN
jgi:hypothetical protein